LFFSIITPTFNSAKYLKKHIDSLNVQSKIFEQIFVDNLSSDSTVKIIKDKAKYPYKIVSAKDDGIYEAMNKGIQLAKGKYLLFLNSDDWLDNDIFYYASNQIKKNNNYDVYFGNTKYFENNKLIFSKKSNIKKINITNSISHQATYYSKNIFKYFTYDLSYKISADYDLNLKLIKNKFKFFYLNNYLSNNTLGGRSSNLLISFKDFFKIQKKYNGLLKATIFTLFEYKFKIIKLILKKIYESKN
jgi:glycosyltransferase involved in cell wall biosynthesis